MGKAVCYLLAFAFVAAATLGDAARVLPGEALEAQKNVVYLGGIGGMSGVGDNGIPFGGFGAGMGSNTGNGNFNGVGGYAGTGPQGGFAGFGSTPGRFTSIGNLPTGFPLGGGLPATGSSLPVPSP